MATLASLQSVFRLLLADKTSTIQTDIGATAVELRDEAIKEAIRWYSRRVPRIVTALVSGAASPYYAVPSGWLVNTSRIVSAEYPINQDPPAYVSPRAWRLVQRETAPVLYFSPNPGGSFRLTFTGTHDETTPAAIPVEHEPIVGRMAVALAALSFAAFYGNTVQNNIDSVGYRTKEQEWRAINEADVKQAEAELRPHEIQLQRILDPMTYFPRQWVT